MEKKRGERWGAKCQISSCGIRKRDFPEIRFFQFPQKEHDKFPTWVSACGIENPPLSKRAYICEKHFEAKYIGKRYLRTKAVPTINVCNQSNEKSNSIDIDETRDFNILFSGKTYSGPKLRKCEGDITFEEIEELEPSIHNKNDITDEIGDIKCPSCVNVEKNKRYYLEKYQTLLKKYKRLEKRFNNVCTKSRKRKSYLVRRTIEKHAVVKEVTKPLAEIIKSIENVSPSAKTFATMLLCRNLKNEPWCEEAKKIALGIHFKSPATYNFLRNLHLNLPSLSSIYRWLPIKDLQPGFNNDITTSLSSLTKNWDFDQKAAVLIFDEIAIKQDLTYNRNKDEIIGFVDLGDLKENKIAKQVCVFMLRGLFSNWKLLISYYASEKGISGKCLAEIVPKILKYCSDLGFKIFAIVCDQGSNNRKCFKELGINKNQPYFIFNENPIFGIYDIPHLFKSVRNLLLRTDLSTSDGEVSWNIVVALHLLESKQGTKMAYKLSSKHVYPNTWQKMNVALAMQVMSRRTVAAIRTASDLNMFSNSRRKKANSTAFFFEKMDIAFDCLNSKSPVSQNPYKRGLRKNGLVREHLVKMIDYLRDIKYKIPSKNYCINGLILSINSILGLADHIFSRYDEKQFLLTNKLNQDPLENLFSIIRSRCGNNNNPSLDSFNKIVGRIMSQKMITYSPEGSNCEDDDEELCIIPNCDFKSNEKHSLEKCTSNEGDLNDSVEEERGEVIFETIQEKFLEKTMLNEDASLRYFVGYVANSHFKKHECNSCLEELIKIDEDISIPTKSELLIYYRNYSSDSNFGNLRAPTDKFFNISKICLSIFKVVFNESPERRHIKDYIVKKCVTHINKVENYSHWFSLENPCREHHIQLLDFFILVLLLKHSQWTSKELPNKSDRKLKIITNKHKRSAISKKGFPVVKVKKSEK